MKERIEIIAKQSASYPTRHLERQETCTCTKTGVEVRDNMNRNNVGDKFKTFINLKSIANDVNLW